MERKCYVCKHLGCRTCGATSEYLESYCTLTNKKETETCEKFEAHRNQKGQLLDCCGRVAEEKDEELEK